MASPKCLLAIKLMASRVGRDEDDVLLRFDLCGFRTLDEGLDLVEQYYGPRPIEAKVRYFLEELLDRTSLPGN